LTKYSAPRVAMSSSTLEVFEIELWPLPQYQNSGARRSIGATALRCARAFITETAITNSQFKAISHEKDPPPVIDRSSAPVASPPHRLRSRARAPLHPDFRIARESLIISASAQVIRNGRPGGLRRVLLTQAKRSSGWRQRRFDALGGRFGERGGRSRRGWRREFVRTRV